MHDHGTTFYRIIDLGGMKRERAQVTGIEHRHIVTLAFGECLALASVNFYAKGMGSIVDDLQPVLVGDVLDSVYFTRLAIDMDRHNGCGSRSDGCLYSLRIHTSRCRINVHKNRLNSIPPKSVCSSHKTVWSSYYFTGYS